ncbi:MAG: hypothetical protein HOH66_12235, partial [Rhodospirillaceae bacterium]|nr:hypothetical protein [Rhodospirillaceae bacterium]
MADRYGEAEIRSQWARVRGGLRAEFGEATYRSWFKPLTLKEVRDGRATVAVPTRFIRDWVVSNYSDRICEMWNGLNESLQALDIIVEAPMSGTVVKTDDEDDAATAPEMRDDIGARL